MPRTPTLPLDFCQLESLPPPKGGAWTYNEASPSLSSASGVRWPSHRVCVAEVQDRSTEGLSQGTSGARV